MMIDSRICAVVVTYNPTATIVDTIAALAQQVAEVVVVDNGSAEDSLPFLGQVGRQDNCRVFFNGKNLGIAAAFNTGVQLARDAGYPWIALFDQDSRVPCAYFTGLLQALQSHPHAERVGLVAPRLKDPVTALTGSHGIGVSGVPYEEVPITISSGCLIRNEVFARVGLFAEELFIDYVDHDYALRMRLMGYLLLESTGVYLEHRIGATSRHSVCGMPVKVTNHSPRRRYYMTRNRIVLYRRYGARFASWAINDMYCMLKELLGIVLFERQKTLKVKMVLLGIQHALTGHLGPLQPAEGGSVP